MFPYRPERVCTLAIRGYTHGHSRRYRRACGFNVLHPMAGFVRLPAEQYASDASIASNDEANITNFTARSKPRLQLRLVARTRTTDPITSSGPMDFPEALHSYSTNSGKGRRQSNCSKTRSLRTKRHLSGRKRYLSSMRELIFEECDLQERERIRKDFIIHKRLAM